MIEIDRLPLSAFGRSQQNCHAQKRPFRLPANNAANRSPQRLQPPFGGGTTQNNTPTTTKDSPSPATVFANALNLSRMGNLQARTPADWVQAHNRSRWDDIARWRPEHRAETPLENSWRYLFCQDRNRSTRITVRRESRITQGPSPVVAVEKSAEYP